MTLTPPTLSATFYSSPIGNLIIGARDQNIYLCDWDWRQQHKVHMGKFLLEMREDCVIDESHPTDILRLTVNQLDEYFKGMRKVFSIPVAFSGTPFQCRVWDELLKIPYGRTMTYGQITMRTGNRRASRAVAAAIAANPISILVPCHRVIGTRNRLTGYAGGISAKSYLLELEKSVVCLPFS